MTSFRKRYCALELAEIRFRSNWFSSKCSRSEFNIWRNQNRVQGWLQISL